MVLRHVEMVLKNFWHRMLEYKKKCADLCEIKKNVCATYRENGVEIYWQWLLWLMRFDTHTHSQKRSIKKEAMGKLCFLFKIIML